MKYKTKKEWSPEFLSALVTLMAIPFIYLTIPAIKLMTDTGMFLFISLAFFCSVGLEELVKAYTFFWIKERGHRLKISIENKTGAEILEIITLDRCLSVGIGFAVVETLLRYLPLFFSPLHSIISVVILISVSIVVLSPVHALFNYIFIQGLFRKNNIMWFLISVLLHTGYNLLILYREDYLFFDFLSRIFIVISLLFFIKVISRRLGINTIDDEVKIEA